MPSKYANASQHSILLRFILHFMSCFYEILKWQKARSIRFHFDNKTYSQREVLYVLKQRHTKIGFGIKRSLKNELQWIEVQHVAFGFVRWNIGLPCHSLWFWRMNDTCCFIFATCHNTLKLQQLYASIDTLNHKKKCLRKENNNSCLNNTSQKKWWPSFHFWKSSVFVVMSTLIMDYTLLTRWMW